MRNPVILSLICFFYGGSIYSQKANPKKFVTIALAGDIMMGTDFPSDDYLPKNGGRDLFADAAPFIRKADCAFANLEGTLFDDSCTIKKCAVPESCYIFRTPVSYATHLADAGFDYGSPWKKLAIATNQDALIIIRHYFVDKASIHPCLDDCT
ncbi:MAG: CapA family protein [Prevotellaceae bacterium]|nr:CapA family protein [Prevotellaceae bacterium]